MRRHLDLILFPRILSDARARSIGPTPPLAKLPARRTPPRTRGRPSSIKMDPIDFGRRPSLSPDARGARARRPIRKPRGAEPETKPKTKAAASPRKPSVQISRRKPLQVRPRLIIEIEKGPVPKPKLRTNVKGAKVAAERRREKRRSRGHDGEAKNTSKSPKKAAAPPPISRSHDARRPWNP